jgi:hypothetical protein
LACRNAPFSSSKTDQVGKRTADINRHENHATPPAVVALVLLGELGLNWGGSLPPGR